MKLQDRVANDWIAVDLDETLFSRRWTAPTSVPATWRKTAASADHTPSSWMTRPIHRLMVALARHFELVPVTARDVESFARVCIPHLEFNGPAVLANGAVIAGGDKDMASAWENGMVNLLTPHQNRLARLVSAIRLINDSVLRTRIAAGPAGLGAFVIVKGPYLWWESPAFDSISAAVRELPEVADFRMLANGGELQILPPGIGKKFAVEFLQKMHFAGTPALLAFGDAIGDLDFMAGAQFLAWPGDSQIGSAVRQL